MKKNTRAGKRSSTGSSSRASVRKPTPAASTLRKEISRRKEAERRLRLSEEMFAKAFHLSPDAVNINRLVDGVYLDINAGFTRTTGYTREDVIGRSSLPGDLGLWVRGEDRDRLVAGLRERGEVEGLEAEFRMKDGRVRTGLMSARIMELEGEPCILSVTRDISDRKKAEGELRDSEERYRHLIETMPDGVYRSTHEGKFLEVNPAMVKILGYGSKEELMAIHIPSQLYFAASDRESAALEEQLEEMAVFRLRKKDGSEVWVEDHGRHVLDADGNVLYHEGILRDVTERTRAQEAIVRSLREKEVLLKEIHHRVKNNLQVVSSLLSMQSAEMPEGPARLALKESQSRVRSMALVHEKLYGTSDFSRVDLLAYSESLANQMARSWHHAGVEISVRGESVQVGIDNAVPCGLILNELLSNALKHAFTGRDSGTVVVTVRRPDQEHVEMSVRDDGVGFPAEKELYQMVSMGMTLVVNLVDQISGKITLVRENGTTFTVTFAA
jgi:PAS domain S-box-containing protein